jgi:hypothetical protein
MANISQTAANVAVGGQSTKTQIVQYGESVTQGMPLYKSTTDSKWYQTDANDGLAKARCGAIALTPGAGDGYGLVALPATTPGQALVNLGATLTIGEVYAVSATKGAIAPVADIGSTQFVTVIGIATTAALLDFQVAVGTVAKA